MKLTTTTIVAMTAGLCVLIVLVFLVTSPSVQPKLLALVGITQADIEAADRRRVRDDIDDEGKIWHEVSSQHSRVTGWVGQCLEMRELPLTAASVGDGPTISNEAPRRNPHRYESALTHLSNALRENRVQLTAKLNDTYRFAQFASFATIVLGLVTTVLVAVNNSKQGQEQGNWQAWVRLAAIIAPALGSAAATFVAFYNPQAEWTQTSRTLANLTQFHNQMSLDTWRLDCIEFEGDKLKANSETNKEIKVRFAEWTKRYFELQAGAGPAGQAEKAAATTGATTGSGPGAASIPGPGVPK